MPLPDDRARAALLEPWLQRLPTPLFGGAKRPREPPLCRPRVPFLGDALRFGRDAGAFLAAERARHGDVFTVLIAGQRMTFVLDPHDAPQVLKQTEALRFHDLADKILVHAFGMDPAVVARSDAAVLHSLFGQHTKGPVLPALSARFGALVQRHLRAGPPHEGGLYERIYEPLFLAALDLLFGEGAADRRAYQDFRLFDDAFPLLAAGVPVRLLPRARAARRRLGMTMAALRPGASTLAVERQAYLRGLGADERALNTSLTWAALANTAPAAFWTVAHVLADPAARAAVRDEVDAAPLPLDEDALRRMVHLDSAIKEALRLSTGSLVLRQAACDLDLELSEGRVVRVRAGDRVCMYPYMTHHDPEIYPDPERFRHDRFLGEGPPQFFKAGRRLTIPLMPYGGGVSMCPGRFLAHQEIKVFVTHLLKAEEIDLIEPLPGLQLGRAGLGILPPARDPKARFRSRHNAV